MRGYIKNGKYIKGKMKEDVKLSETYNEDRRQKQREDHRKDVVQPYSRDGKPNPEFAHAYPDLAHKYFSTEDLRSL